MTLAECANLLLAKTCICGKRKRPNTVFCIRCWRSLVWETQRALYRGFGAGFEEAHAQALKELGRG